MTRSIWLQRYRLAGADDQARAANLLDVPTGAVSDRAQRSVDRAMETRVAAIRQPAGDTHAGHQQQLLDRA